ncbi:hypothetical protein ACNOYE_27020 [Nannocystaceae bacterium ST9]
MSLLFTLACAEPAGNEDDIADEGESSSAGDESESETGPIPESLAHDIDISLVEINQGVATPIAIEGEWIGPADRNAQIVANRDSLLRAHWTLAPEFEPREILGRLTIEPPAGEPIVRDQIADISADSYPGDLSRTFTWDLVADAMLPGTKFSVSLWEVDPSFAALPPPELPPISPRDGTTAAIGIQPELMAIKVVIVPITANWADCQTTVPIDEVLTNFHDMLMMKNPTQTVELSVREQGLVYDAPLVGFWDILPDIQQARIDDAAPANVYYYGIVDACTPDLDGAGGMSWDIVSAEKTADFQRVSAGLYLDYDQQWNADTFVHELGHLQGLAHVYCPGQNSAGPDPAYPYEDGVIGVWGFGIRDFQLRSPTSAHDYMSYCYEGNWTSDWTWAKNFARIATLTSWDSEDAAPEPSGILLIGVLPDAGGERWYTIPGRIPSASLERDRVLVRAFAADEVLEPAATTHRPPDAAATIVTLELAGAAMPDRIETLAGPSRVWRPRE